MEKLKAYKKGMTVEIDVTDVNNLGCGVGRLEDGKVIFVKGAVTGDRIFAEIIKDNKSYAVARLCSVINASPYRFDGDFCSAPFSCGGCVYRHVTYEHEKQIKYNFVRSAFDKAGLSDALVLPVMSTDRVTGYRNKGQYPVCHTKDGMRTGFYASKTHKIVPADACAIQPLAFAKITAAVCELCDRYGVTAYDENTRKGLLRHIYLRIAEITGEVMLCLVLNGEKLPREAEFCKEIREKFPEICGVIINENKENTNVVLGKKYRVVSGKGYIEDELCGLRFRISPESFYQVNREGAELLYSLAAQKAELDGSQTLADLYCGTGTIGLSMAKKARNLVGIEIVEGAVECAKLNAESNGIENARFICGDAGDPNTILGATGGKCPDVVVIDPPRKGSTKELAECLAGLGVPRIVYVSCDPTTLARDCVWFRELGYEIGEVQPVDLFPRTGHVETVALLSRQIDVHKMKLNSAPFEMIKSGEKTIELRLFDEKRQQLKVGDKIVFTDTTTGETLNTTVVKLHRFDSFEELYKSLPLLKCGYTTENVDNANSSDMEEYYSVEEQRKHGVVGIELCRPKNFTDESVVCLTRKKQAIK